MTIIHRDSIRFGTAPERLKDRPQGAPVTSARDETAERPDASGDQPQGDGRHVPPGRRSARWGLFLIPVLALLALGVFHQFDADLPRLTEGTKALQPGAILSRVDAIQSGHDYTLEFQPDVGETSVLIWDYAAEDGDWVQVKVNGVPLGEPFMIFNTPRTLRVPTNAVMEVVGIRDGGGGITYAVNFPPITTSIANGAAVGSSNSYSLVRHGAGVK